MASVSGSMLRSLVTLLLIVAAFGFLAAGIWRGVAGGGDVNFGVTAALLCVAPMLALLALAVRLGLGERDEEDA
jgi:hypothetical protein